MNSKTLFTALALTLASVMCIESAVAAPSPLSDEELRTVTGAGALPAANGSDAKSQIQLMFGPFNFANMTATTLTPEQFAAEMKARGSEALLSLYAGESVSALGLPEGKTTWEFGLSTLLGTLSGTNKSVGALGTLSFNNMDVGGTKLWIWSRK